MKNQLSKIIFAITSHGLGHLTRTIAVIREFFVLYPNVEVVISTSIDKNKIAANLPHPFFYREQDYEPGVIQTNCFEVDFKQTQKAYQVYFKERKSRLKNEEEFIKSNECQGLVSDIPALPIRAAANLGIPAIGLSNFTWDWILTPILNGGPSEYIIKQIESDYRSGKFHIQLPFGPDYSPFYHSEKAPIISRKAKLSKFEVQRCLNIPNSNSHKLVVVCPGGWDPINWESIHVTGCSSFRFIMVGNLPITTDSDCLHLPHDLPHGLTFPDLVETADIVVAKPGYGIASECLLHNTPLVAIERPKFRETPYLLDTFRRYCPCIEISLKDFFSGKWEHALMKAVRNDFAWVTVPDNGAKLIAQRLGELLLLKDVFD